jgi:hypothetical protein
MTGVEPLPAVARAKPSSQSSHRDPNNDETFGGNLSGNI